MSDELPTIDESQGDAPRGSSDQPTVPEAQAGGGGFFSADDASPGGSSASPHDASERGVKPNIPGYDIHDMLGHGGMGEVWRATQLDTQRDVALKVMTGVSAAARQRFIREVELASRLEHPNIATVYDSGVRHGLTYYAMRLVDGVPLDTFVEQHNPSRTAVLELMATICRAVQHAHQRGIIHRDLKPANILVESPAGGEASPVLLDFGLAKHVEPGGEEDATQTMLSRPGQVAGTLAYMAPEQASGDPDAVDTRTDVYTLGVILYRLLLGVMPRDTSGSVVEALSKIRDGEVIRPRNASRKADKPIDDDLEALLLKAMERDPDQRYNSAGELADDIDHYLHNDPLTARPATTMYFLRKRLVKHRRGIGLGSAAVIAALLAIGGVAGYYTHKAYYQQVHFPVDSEPRGAQVYLNGELKHKCSTPTSLYLGPGVHTVELRHRDGYWMQPREVRVQWGKVSREGFEPIVMRPGFRTFVFNSEPTGARLELRDATTGELTHTYTTPAVEQVPKGRYRMRLFAGDRSTPEPGELLEVVGNAKPLTITRDIPVVE